MLGKVEELVGGDRSEESADDVEECCALRNQVHPVVHLVVSIATIGLGTVSILCPCRRAPARRRPCR